MKRFLSFLMLLLAACSPTTQTALSPTAPTNVIQYLTAPPLTGPITLSTTALSPVPTSELAQYTIDALRQRTYGSGDIEIVQTLAEIESFTRYQIRYPSDDLTIYGFVNVPNGPGPYPIIVAVHGYVDTNTYLAGYETGAYDGLANAGYIVAFPFMRTYPPSDDGDNLFRVGMTVDVLHLIALMKSNAGPGEIFDRADTEHIGLWGHSLGGGIVLRTLTVLRDIRAAVLYASVSGDERKNSELLWRLYADPFSQGELNASPEIVAQVSPANYYRSITAPVQLFHGTADAVVPVAWAEETCADLNAAGVTVNCTYFPGEDHTFRSRVADQFNGLLLSFYEKYLKP